MIHGFADEWSELERTDCTICRITAYRVSDCDSHLYRCSVPRTDYALTFCRTGQYHYESDDHPDSFDCYPGDISVLPMGSRYHHASGDIPSSMTVIYFSIFNEAGQPYRMRDVSIRKISPADSNRFAQLFDHVQDAFFSAIPSGLQLKSALYALLSAIGQECSSQQIGERESVMLEPALRILSSSTTGTITVSGLAAACHLSEYAFRELFKKYTGVPPKTYLMERRLEQVEALLAVKDISATDAARSCGFDDPSYFFHFYKRLRGHPPGCVSRGSQSPGISSCSGNTDD